MFLVLKNHAYVSVTLLITVYVSISTQDGIIESEDAVFGDLATIKAGENPSRMRKHSALLNDRRIHNFSEDLSKGEISVRQFLLRASWSVSEPVPMGLDGTRKRRRQINVQ